MASVDDRLDAIQKAHAYAATRTGVAGNVTSFPAGLSTLEPHVAKNGQVSEGTWLGGRDSNPDSLVQSQLSYH